MATSRSGSKRGAAARGDADRTPLEEYPPDEVLLEASRVLGAIDEELQAAVAASPAFAPIMEGPLATIASTLPGLRALADFAPQLVAMRAMASGWSSAPWAAGAPHEDGDSADD